MNNNQTVKSAAGVGGVGGTGGTGAGGSPRRLGRGLSSLLSMPVAVEVGGSTAPDATARAARRTEAPARGGASADGGGTAAEPPATAPSLAKSGAGAGEPEGGATVVMIALDRIVPNRFQPRRKFEEAGLAELAASIRAAGVVQPILVRRSDVSSTRDRSDRYNSGSYELVAGERRWRAAALAGLKTLPAVVAELSDEQSAEWALIENVQRSDLGAMEQAYAVRQLCERFGLTHQQAAEKLGLDRTTVTNLIRLTDLEEEARGLLESGALTAAHGKVLLAMAPGPRRATLAKRAAESGWSVRRLGGAVAMMMKGDADGAAPEDAVRAAVLLSGDKRSAAIAKAALADAGMRELEKQLSDHLATKVKINVRPGGRRGSLKIEFYDLDQFDGLMAKMGFVMR